MTIMEAFRDEQCEACKEVDAIYNRITKEIKIGADPEMAIHLLKYHCTCKTEAP